jgi:hypothetical protein
MIMEIDINKIIIDVRAASEALDTALHDALDARALHVQNESWVDDARAARYAREARAARAARDALDTALDALDALDKNSRGE